jgi:hypothetical protein
VSDNPGFRLYLGIIYLFIKLILFCGSLVAITLSGETKVTAFVGLTIGVQSCEKSDEAVCRRHGRSAAECNHAECGGEPA